MPADYHLSPTQPLRLPELAQLLATRATVRLSEEAKARIQASEACWRQQLEKEPGQLAELIQGPDFPSKPPPNGRRPASLPAPAPADWLLAHAAGTGAELPPELVRLLLLLKAQSLSQGHGGAPLAVVQRLLDLYNRELYPVVYEQGAGGAFGDSSALAHLCLPLLGLGEVNYQGYRLAAADALSLFSWAPLRLPAGEGLALLSGTQFTLAYAVEASWRAERLARAADVIGALSVEGFGGRAVPFDERLAQLRPHAGQVEVARRLRALLADSALSAQLSATATGPVPYSFRCLPQVHGAGRDALAYAQQIIETECNSATEALAVFPEADAVLSGGNFHGQPLSLALDQLARAVAGLGGLSARRTRQLVGLVVGRRELPAGPAVAEPAALTSGLPALSHTAASLVSQNQQLCTAASAGFISSGPGPADHLSLGAIAATNARRVVENAEQILAVELLTAAQTIAFRRPGRSSETLELVLAALEAAMPPEGPPARAPYLELQAAAGFVRRFEWP